MKIVVQRVKEAEVKVDGKIVGKIRKRILSFIRCNTYRYKRKCRLFSKKAM